MLFDKQSTILVTCENGLAPYLQQELAQLGFEDTQAHRTGVEFEGSFEETWLLNLYLRNAYNVLFLVDEWTCRSPQELYERVVTHPWHQTISPDEYISVVSRIQTPSIDNSMFAGLKVKDAIVDEICNAVGRRPDSGSERDNVVIHLYWYDTTCRLFINTSGKKISDRGYRRNPHKAPLRESLASAILTACEYDGSMPLVNPMCGSGTLAIEAALMGLNRTPGLLRDNFGFLHLLGIDQERWQDMRKEARKRARKELPCPIIASDIDPEAVEAARKNAMTAGVDRFIDFHVCDFSDTPVPEEASKVILNPEYGKRLGEIETLMPLYKRIGDWLKHGCAGHTGYVFTGNLELAKQVGLKASRRFPFWNAKIDCRLLQYELYKGTRRTPVVPEPPM